MELYECLFNFSALKLVISLYNEKWLVGYVTAVFFVLAILEIEIMHFTQAIW